MLEQRSAAATRAAARILLALSLLLLSASTVDGATPKALPYIPTSILLPGTATGSGLIRQDGFPDGIAYIFSPTASSVDLLALNISSTLSASSLSPKTISSGLPFLNGPSASTVFAPSLVNGTFSAFVGGCSRAPAVWTLQQPNATTEATSIWEHHKQPFVGTGSSQAGGPLALGNSLSFSSQIEPTVSLASVYAFGGMCPRANASSEASWTAAADYSNQMIKLSLLENGAYNMSPVSSSGSPIAAAGFSWTSLTPSLSNRSGIVTQQVNHVLLGGHTRSAFINMSRAAVWSLPEETWNFVSIQQPIDGEASTELARSLPTRVESRSGHTAVLSEDGTSLIILGGWVGGISQAAQPQLAVLKMGTAFDEWKWTIPTAQPTGSGIFGHGAVLLPGNTMMVYGGYSTSGSTARLKTRQAGGAGDAPMFLNLTSMTWTEEYTNPSYTPIEQSGSASSGTTSSRDIGLGVGLGVGLAALIAIVAIAIVIRRRRRRNRRTARDSTMRALAQDASMFLPDDDTPENDDVFFPSWNSEQARDWYTGGGDAYARGSMAGSSGSSGRSLGYGSLRGSRVTPSFYPPSRKPVNPRNVRGLHTGSRPDSMDIHPTLSPRGAGNIHPIYEADEDGDPGHDAASDPFMTPVSVKPRGGGFDGDLSAPEMAMSGALQQQDHEVRGWMDTLDVADAVLSARIGPHSTTTTKGLAGAAAGTVVITTGRLSPTRRVSLRSTAAASPSRANFVDEEGRTVSTLSDSNRSAFSYAVSRSGSERSRPGTNGGIVSLATAAAEAGANRDDDRRLESSSASSEGGRSFNTAQSSFAALQAEGPALLARGVDDGSRPLSTSLLGGVTSPSPQDGEDEYAPGSPSKSKARRSWLGSLKRVFSSSANESLESIRNESPASFEGGDYEPRLVGLGGVLQRRKQGREAWEEAGEDSFGRSGSYRAASTSAGADGGGRYGSLGQDGGHDSDWDIERAVEQRLVQVMFTVPKERLRVVNAEIEKEEQAELVDPDQEEGEFDEKQHLAAMAATEDKVSLPQEEDHLMSTPRGRQAEVLHGHRAVSGEQASTSLGLKYPEKPSAAVAPGPSGDEWDPFWDGPALVPAGAGAKLTPDMVRVPAPVEGRTSLGEADLGVVRHGGDAKDLASAETSRLSTDDAPTVIMTAEAVRLLRRQPTRVLEMVEQIEEQETRSRSGTPGGSPARG